MGVWKGTDINARWLNRRRDVALSSGHCLSQDHTGGPWMESRAMKGMRRYMCRLDVGFAPQSTSNVSAFLDMLEKPFLSSKTQEGRRGDPI